MSSTIFPVLIYMHALIEILHMIYGLILDDLTFDSLSRRYPEVILKRFI